VALDEESLHGSGGSVERGVTRAGRAVAVLGLGAVLVLAGCGMTTGPGFVVRGRPGTGSGSGLAGLSENLARIPGVLGLKS
jgi:hypothetical protein